MNNKVLISAAGRGTRMDSLSVYQPKHLINVDGKPFLHHLLANLKEAGFREIIMVVAYKQEMIVEFLKNYNKQFNITILNQSAILGQDEYGTACPLRCAQKILKNENFLAVYGDNLYSVEDLKSFDSKDNYSYIAGLAHDKPQNYGVLQVGDDGFLESIIEKPHHPRGNLINTGLYKFSPDVFTYLPQISISARGEYELTDVVDLMAKARRVKVKSLNGVWLDLGKPEDVVKVEQYIRDAKKLA